MTDLRSIMETQAELLCEETALELGLVYIDDDGIDVGFVMTGRFDDETITNKLNNNRHYLMSMSDATDIYTLHDEDDEDERDIEDFECYNHNALSCVDEFRNKLVGFGYEIGYVKVTMKDGELFANYFVSNT